MEKNNFFDDLGNFLKNGLGEINEKSENILDDVNSYVEDLPSKIDATTDNFSQVFKSTISSFQSEIVEPISLKLEKVSKELDIEEEKEAIYQALDISSDEEFVEIICILVAAGISISLFIFVLLYLEGSISLGASLPLLQFCDDVSKNQKLDIQRIQHINFLLGELDKQKYFNNNLYLENIRLNGLYQESIRIRQGANNQYYIDRRIDGRIINADNKQLSISENMVAPIVLASLIESFIKGNIDMNQIKQKGNFGIGQISGGTISGNAKIAGVLNEAAQQNLTEAAQEIQKLLEQLSQTYPTTTNREKNMVVGEAVDQIESNPTLKSKVINALKAGGTEAFKEAIDHPLVNILVATIEGWQET